MAVRNGGAQWRCAMAVLRCGVLSMCGVDVRGRRV